MKWLRLLLFFILALVLTTGLLSLLMATSQKVNRSVTIHAPANLIFDQLKLLSNFSRFSVWGGSDSSIQYQLQGTDATPGAKLSWKGAPEISGEGSIEISSLTRPHTVAHTLHFITPQKADASSIFSIIESDKNFTTVTWYFELYTPRPKNIFNLFYSLDKQMGKDFETGLEALKTYTESLHAASLKPAP